MNLSVSPCRGNEPDAVADRYRPAPTASDIHLVEDEDAEREEVILSKLGARGWGRLRYFRRFCSQSWGEGRNRPLSPRALEALYRFLAAYPSWEKEKPPSLFLTDDGRLELCWEDRAGRPVQVLFGPTGVDYYLEAVEEEGSVPFVNLADLAQKLSRV